MVPGHRGKILPDLAQYPEAIQRRSLLKATLVLFALVQVYRGVIYRLGYVTWAAWGFDTRIDAVLMGSSLAIALKLQWLPPRLLLRPLSLWTSLGLVVLLSGLTWVHRLRFGVLIAVYPLAIILVSVIARSPRILNNGGASFFGKISYSLYLFNPLVVYLVGKISFLQGAVRVAVGTIAAILAATFSYYLVERPFLRMKDRTPCMLRKRNILGPSG